MGRRNWLSRSSGFQSSAVIKTGVAPNHETFVSPRSAKMVNFPSNRRITPSCTLRARPSAPLNLGTPARVLLKSGKNSGNLIFQPGSLTLCGESSQIPSLPRKISFDATFHAIPLALSVKPQMSPIHISFSIAPSSQVWYMSQFSNPSITFDNNRRTSRLRDLIDDAPKTLSSYPSLYATEFGMGEINSFLRSTFHTGLHRYLYRLTLTSFQSSNLWRNVRSCLIAYMELMRRPQDGTCIYFDGAISLKENCAGIGIYIPGVDKVPSSRDYRKNTSRH
ncbi:hypothetical protein DH2020_032215 [Rehmannia glutinosa]|uniref:Uncharacterized protein n=1 Tax=Rehmannia glutinosa TaxID=99300 RepID=A0ABR0VIP5_REHGL